MTKKLEEIRDELASKIKSTATGRIFGADEPQVRCFKQGFDAACEIKDKEIAALKAENEKLSTTLEATRTAGNIYIDELRAEIKELKELVTNVPTYINDITELKRQLAEKDNSILLEKQIAASVIQEKNERIKRLDSPMRCGQCGNKPVWNTQIPYLDTIAEKDARIVELEKALQITQGHSNCYCDKCKEISTRYWSPSNIEKETP